MKRIYLANILIFLSAFTTVVNADAGVLANPPPAPNTSDAASTDTSTSDQPEIDPTLAFFTALSTCTPGIYSEKNILTTEVGQPMLTQQIIGLSDDKLTCNATLTTPDNRTMTCSFPMDQLPEFSDQHFLRGMLADTTDNPGQDSLNADMRWSQMKANSCSFGE